MSRKDTRLNGLQPLSYLGVEPLATPYFLSNDRAPTTNDKFNFQVGDFWLNRNTLNPWTLVSLENNDATWIKLATSSSVAYEFVTDSGSAIPSGGILNIVGSSELSTSGATNVVDVDISSSNDGEILIGATGSDPAWANITSTGATITITNAANSINLEGPGTGQLQQFTSDAGVATPTAGVVDVVGGANIDTSAASDTLTVSLSDDVTIAGTLTLSYLGAGVGATNSSGLISSSTGNDGQVLIGATGSDPAWANITSTGASVTITNAANSINLEVVPPVAPIDSGFLAVLTGTHYFQYFPALTSFQLGLTTGAVMTEIYDNNSDFFPGNGTTTGATFTAPQTGKYHLTMRVKYNATIATTGGVGYVRRLWIATTKYLYTDYRVILNGATYRDSRDSIGTVDVLAEMDMGDTATYSFFYQAFLSGTATDYDCNIEGGTTADMETYVSGSIVE